MSEVRLIDANVADKILTELCIAIQDTGNVSGVSGTIVKSVRPCVTTGVRAAQVALNNIPTIEAEPVRHGRWIKQENGMNVCSACGVIRVSHFPFCGNCGARMDADHIADVSKKVGGTENDGSM